MFDYAEGDDEKYEYTSEEFSELIKQLSGTGILNSYGDKFECTANGLDITMSSGMCMILGRYGGNTSPKTFSLDAETIGIQRIDRIVLAVDISNRVIKSSVIKGIASASPTAPALTQTETYYEIPVYRATISNGSTVTLTDEKELIYTPTEMNVKINDVLSALAGMQTALNGKIGGWTLLTTKTLSSTDTVITTIASQAGKKELLVLYLDNAEDTVHGRCVVPLGATGVSLFPNINTPAVAGNGTFDVVSLSMYNATTITFYSPNNGASSYIKKVKVYSR